MDYPRLFSLKGVIFNEHKQFRFPCDRFPDSKVYGANMGLTWGRQDPGGPMLAPWTLLSGLLPCNCCMMLFHKLDAEMS